MVFRFEIIRVLTQQIEGQLQKEHKREIQLHVICVSLHKKATLGTLGR